MKKTRSAEKMAKKNRLPPEILLSAYTKGYFPMPDSETDEILWYRPDPRAIFDIGSLKVSKSFKRTLNKADFEIKFSTDFVGVMKACADRKDTWITKEFVESYGRLHELGFAHSVEVFQDNTLVGGTYGVCIRGAFFAESMFHKRTDMSKVALWALHERLKKRGFKLLECQYITDHLSSLGAKSVPDLEYQQLLQNALSASCSFI